MPQRKYSGQDGSVYTMVCINIPPEVPVLKAGTKEVLLGGAVDL